MIQVTINRDKNIEGDYHYLHYSFYRGPYKTVIGSEEKQSARGISVKIRDAF